jgi:hypothetical protein
MDVLTLSTCTDAHLPQIRQTLLDIYAEVYAAEIAADPFFSVERFDERLTRQTFWTAPGHSACTKT